VRQYEVDCEREGGEMSVKRFGFGAVNFREAEKEQGAFVLWNDYEALRASHEELYKAASNYLISEGPDIRSKHCGHIFTCVCPGDELKAALANAQKVREG
jgi:hypothetical protein